MYPLPFWRRVRTSRVLVVIACALAALPLYAASVSTTPLSLKAATQIATARAPQVQAQILRTQAARHDAVRAGRLPGPELTAGINDLAITGPQAFNAMADAMTMRTIGLTQVFPSYAKREAQKAIAQAGVQLNGADVIQVRLAAKRATAGAWARL